MSLSLSQPQKDKICKWHNKSKWGQTRKTQGQGKGQGGRGIQSSKHETCKLDRTIASTVYKNMKFISKKKGEDVAEVSSKAYIMSLFKDKDVKKAM
eukprot:8037303-Ditylum_brightwellii.AAC.2